MYKVLKINGRNVTISLILADITKLNVDVIVNAAHQSLMGGGGVDGAIHKAAGPSLLAECRTIKDINGVRCQTGEVHITKGHALPAKYIIHTVAPKFVGGLIRREINGEMIPVFKNNYPERDTEMANCYRNCIDLADLNKLKSIAFPSLGTGGHAYPIEVACPIAIKSTVEALSQTEHIENVVFVCFSENDFDYYKKILDETIG